MVRPRIPTSRQLAEGDRSKRGKRFLQAKLDAEPRAQEGLPPAPEYLPPLARETYNSWREQLELLGIDHKPDAQGLEAAAMAYCRAVEALLIVEHDGQIIDEPVFYQGKPVAGVTRLRKHPATTGP